MTAHPDFRVGFFLVDELIVFELTTCRGRVYPYPMVFCRWFLSRYRNLEITRSRNYEL